MDLFENNDYHRYYDYISDYSPYIVFGMVMNGENLWTPLIKPSMYQKALSEFMKYGKLIHFPSNIIYQWMGIIMKNTAILRSTTEIAGHSSYSAFDDFYDYFFNDEGIDQNGMSWEDFLYEHDLDESDEYEGMTEYLNEIGFYDNLVLPDGSDAWSDFGIDPIEKLISEYNEDLPPEKVLVLINKILDVYHQRGDLSSMFIEGGRDTLSKITYNESKNHKKIYISEFQIKNVLNESLSRNVYHFTSISNALKIAEEDAIFLQSSLEGYSNTANSSKLFYLSTTRVKYQSFGYSRKFSDNSVRIELDGDRLNNDFSAKPYNYWGDDMGKPSYLKNDNKGLTIDKQEHVRDEAEDRLLSDKGVIEPAHKYIKRIDIILSDISEKNRTNYLNVRNLLTSRYSRIVFVYNNLNDFNKQNDKIINQQILDDFDSYGFGNYDKFEHKLNNDAIKIVLAAILNGETDNLQKDSAILLKHYGLERYLKNGLLKYNEYMEYPYSFDFNRLADTLSYKLGDLSKRPSREKQKILQMLSDYFKKNNLRNYKDYIKHKSFSVNLTDDYMLIRKYIDKGYIDPDKKIKVLLIRNDDTYDDVIVTDINKVKVSNFNKDLETVGEFFVNDTWENMKSNSYDSYRKYILNVFKKDPTIGYVIELLKKLGYNDNILEMLQGILNTMVEEKEIGVYDLKYDMVMPQCIYNKKYNVTKFLELFKK